MARLPELKPEDFDAATRKLGDEITKTRGGAIHGPWAHMLRNPELAKRAAHYSDYLRDGISVPRKLALLAVIMTARQWNAGFVWNAQSPQAKAAGVSDAVIEAIRAKKTPSFDDPAEKAVYDLFSGLYSKQAIGDATYAAAEKALGQTGVVEVLNVAGFYGIVASIVNATGVAVRPGQTDPFAGT
jgi:4-carboxymuconolactone decarboxylase